MKNLKKSSRTLAVAFNHAFNMEYDVMAVDTFGRILARLAETLDDDNARLVQQLGWEISTRAKKIEQTRAAIFCDLHPNRVKFEKEG